MPAGMGGPVVFILQRMVIGAVAITPACIASAQQAPGTSPPAGASLAISIGGGWNSNPTEVTARARGDVFIGHEITLQRRWALWEGSAFTLTAQGASEFYGREHKESLNRGLVSVALSQSWQGFFGSITALQRKAMSRDFSAHESASREIALGLGRNVLLADGLSLNLFGRVARRFMEDGTEDQFRASISGTLTHRSGKWIVRVGGGYSYTLEDKTPILPRINTRTVSARASMAYEWAADSEIALRVSFSRSYSSYSFDRTKAFSFGPQIGTTWRF